MRGSLLFLFTSASLVSLSAHAGSVGDSRVSGGSLGMDCDQRQRFINCTELMRSHILDRCYVVIHQTKRSDCTWQSCGHVSVVQKRPRMKGTKIEEYGIQTDVSSYSKSNWECNSSGFAPGECLPKFPFPRNYLSVRKALELRAKPDGSEVSNKIAEVPQDVVDSNPYLECASRQPENFSDHTFVMMHKGTLNSSSPVLAVKVNKKDAAEACDKLKLLDNQGSCVLGSSWSRPNESVPLDKQISSTSATGTQPAQSASPTQPASSVSASQAASPTRCPQQFQSRTRFKYLSVAKGKTCRSQVQRRARNCEIRNGKRVYSAWSQWNRNPKAFSFTSCSVRKR